MPNIYELTVAALLEKQDGVDVAYRDFVYSGKKMRNKFVRFIQQDDSDLYSLWTVNLSIDNDVAVVEFIHRLRAEVLVMMVGPGPTYFTARCLIDERTAVVRGEMDDVALAIALALRDERDWRMLDGVSFLHDGQVHHNRPQPLISDLDARPFPARHLLADRKFHNPKLKTGPYTSMLTSRGCPYGCIYCVHSSLTFAREIAWRQGADGPQGTPRKGKPRVSFRSVESVERELHELNEAGYKAIGFMDDNFIWTEERTLALCAALKKYDFVWGC